MTNPNDIDWRRMYRFQTAMRYMDNMLALTKERAYVMADADIAAMEGIAATPSPTSEQT